MSDFLKDCFQKIGWEKDHVSFGDLPLFLKAMAYRFPFENRAVLAKENYKITKEELWRRLLKDQHGGLCYDLNGFLYFVLREAGFHVKLIRGTVYAGDQEGWALEGTHAAVWLSAENAITSLISASASTLRSSRYRFPEKRYSHQSGHSESKEKRQKRAAMFC